MKPIRAQVLFNDEPRRRRDLTPAWHRHVRIIERRWRRHRIVCGGVLMLVAAGGFAPVLSIRTSSGTETVPNGAQTLTYELWGAGGGGGAAIGSGCAAVAGAGGGGGGMTRGTFAVGTKNGLTWSYTAGTVGAAGSGGNGGNSTTSSVNAGTMTGWNNISVGIATGGQGGGPTVGTGSTCTNTNAGATNTTGNNGSGINGGASIAGVITGDNQASALYGKGGNGHSTAGSPANGVAGNTSGAVFFYT